MTQPFDLDRTDPLTGLPTRAALRPRLDGDCGRARRLRVPLSVLAVDLDHFAEVNARYSHPVGDVVLAGVARRINAHISPGNWVVRDGGDQFAVILPGTGPDGAAREAERLRSAVASAPVQVADAQVAVTVCVGVATLRPEDAGGWEVFARARAAVQQAKDRGRNRVASAEQQA